MTAPDNSRVPWYINAFGRHRPRTMRLLAYMGLAGREGVLGNSHLKVNALGTPGASIQVMPGAFGVLNRALGGAYEAYVDKIPAAETKDVNATGAVGRTDLVILRILNPYETEVGGTIPAPASPEDGPYWAVQIVENVPANTNHISAHNPNWSAITLARITRPALTGIVQQSHITDLRSLVDLSGERIIIIDSPPATPPPIAAAQWSGSKHLSAASTFLAATTAWTDWPTGAFWDVPIPPWAVETDILGSFNPQFDNKIWGECRLDFGGVAGPAVVFDENPPGSAWQRVNVPIMGTYVVPSAQRGKIVRVKLQTRNIDPPNHAGNLVTRNGVYLTVFLNFKKSPT